MIILKTDTSLYFSCLLAMLGMLAFRISNCHRPLGFSVYLLFNTKNGGRGRQKALLWATSVTLLSSENSVSGAV